MLCAISLAADVTDDGSFTSSCMAEAHEVRKVVAPSAARGEVKKRMAAESADGASESVVVLESE